MTVMDGEMLLAALLADERYRPHPALTEALLEKRNAPEPSPVQEAADRLLRVHAPWALDVEGAATRLIARAGNERSRRLFWASSLSADGRSKADLAAEEGVSPERVRQILESAGSRVRAALTEAGGPLPWTVRALRDRLGPLTTESAMAGTLRDLGASGRQAAPLLRWLAGPYLPVPRRPGWIAVEPRRVAARTAGCLAADGGVRRFVDVESDLEDLGIRPGVLKRWLAALGAPVIHDLVVLVSGPLPEALERILDARGTPRTVDQLVADLAAGGRVVDDGRLTAALRGRRFARAKGAVGLAAWGSDERRPDGRPEAPPRSDASATPAPLPPPVPKRLWLRVKVDEETLRGAEAGVPVGLVEGLGLEPPSRRTFSGRWGPVTLAHDGEKATRGSVRAVALAAGARLDDILLMGFSVGGDVSVELRPAGLADGQGEIAATTQASSLRLQAGSELDTGTPHPRTGACGCRTRR